MRRQLSRRPEQRIGERFLRQIDSAAEEDNGEETSQASKSARDAGPSYENISGMRGRAIFGRRGIGRHILYLPSILQEKIRRECMKSILFAIPDEIEIAKDGRFVMLFHDRAATTVNMVHVSIPASGIAPIPLASRNYPLEPVP